MNRLRFFDATLRDGSHAIAHQITTDSISRYCQAIDDAGLYTVIVGHGNGLGASSLQVGLSLHTEDEMLAAAEPHLKKTRLGVYLIPGFGTIHDHIEPAIAQGVRLVKVGCHCTEADVTRQHIEYVRAHDVEAYGVLMMSHMAEPDRLLVEAKKMESYGAIGVILMDSAGALLPKQVTERIKRIVSECGLLVGFHAHNNMSLAVANSLAAIEAGATIVDATLRGFGAGAGNCQLEVLCGILQKMNIDTGLDFYRLLDVCDTIVAPCLQKKPLEISSLSLVGGLSGVFSAFTEHIKKAAVQFNVDPRDIFVELGKRKVVGGQEDMIVDVAMNLAQRTRKDDISFLMESLL
jgi:4-hydroxy 2-oxovalerate aldolase